MSWWLCPELHLTPQLLQPGEGAGSWVFCFHRHSWREEGQTQKSLETGSSAKGLRCSPSPGRRAAGPGRPGFWSQPPAHAWKPLCSSAAATTTVVLPAGCWGFPGPRPQSACRGHSHEAGSGFTLCWKQCWVSICPASKGSCSSCSSQPHSWFL